MTKGEKGIKNIELIGSMFCGGKQTLVHKCFEEYT